MASFPLRVRTLYGVLIPEPLASTYSATAQSLSAPRVGFDCETLEQVNVKGAPPAGNVQERLSFLFNICLLDTLPGEWVVLWAVVGHSPKG